MLFCTHPGCYRMWPAPPHPIHPAAGGSRFTDDEIRTYLAMCHDRRVEVGLMIAEHMRTVHGDEESAAGIERSLVTDGAHWRADHD